MAKDDMAKLPGLFQRGSVYQLRVVVPTDLQANYGKSKIVQSLETADPRQARLLATQERAKLLEEFDLKRRQLQPQRLDTVTPEMAHELAQRVRASVLRVDDVLRDDADARGLLLALLEVASPDPLESLTIRSRSPALAAKPLGFLEKLSGISEVEAAALSHLNALMDGSAGQKLAQRRLTAVLPLVEQEAKQLGLTFDAAAPGAREALKAYRLAWQDVSRRDRGEIVDTPHVLSVATAPLQPSKLRDVYERWKARKPRSPDTHSAVLRSISAYEEFTGNPPLSQLTRSMGDGFRTWLQQPDRKISSKTARDRLTWIKSLLRYASTDLELIPKNPWERLDIAFETESPRRPWTDKELEKFFTQPLYAEGHLPKSKRGGGAAVYWIPLLGLYLGARISELAQLTVPDVENLDGNVPLLSLTDEGEGQNIKTKAGKRRVPIHSELIRLGFLDYVRGVAKTGTDSLWPALHSRKAKPGDYFGRWFSEARKDLGFGEYPDFHCFRHTVRSHMAEAEVPEDVMDTITGHEVKGSTRTKVYTTRKVSTLQKAVETLKYPSLSVPTVFAPT